MRTSTRTPPSDRDRRRRDLADQLRQRRQVADVVDHADRGDRRGAEQDRAGLAVGGQEDPAGDLDPGEDRQPGEPRHRAVVQAALLGRVDRADPEGEPLGVGNQQPGDRGGCDEGEDGVGCRRVHCACPTGKWADQASRRPRQPRARPRRGAPGRAGGGRRPASRACAARRRRRVVEDPQAARRRSAPRRRPPIRPVKVVKTGVPSATASRFIVPPALTTRSAKAIRLWASIARSGTIRLRGADRPRLGALAPRCGG